MSDLKEQIKADRETGKPQVWTAEKTTRASLPENAWAIVWDKTPNGRKNEDGSTSYALRFPMLLGSDWMANPHEGMVAIADALNLAEVAEARITELEAEAASYHDAYEGEKAGREKDSDIATSLYLGMERRLVAAEAALAAQKALVGELVEVLERIDDASNHYAMTPTYSDGTLRYAHKSTRNLARAAITRAKEQS